MDEKVQNLTTKVAVLEDRLERTQKDVTELSAFVKESVQRIEGVVKTIQDKPNEVADFITQNWKTLLMVGAVFLGANATLIDMLKKVVQ